MWDSLQFSFCGHASAPVRWHHRYFKPVACHRLVWAPTRTGTQQPTLTECAQQPESTFQCVICDRGSECRRVWPLRIEGKTSPSPFFSWDVEHTSPLTEVMRAKEGQAKNYILAGRTVCALFLETAISQKANQTKKLLGYFPLLDLRETAWLSLTHWHQHRLFCGEAGRESRHI